MQTLFLRNCHFLAGEPDVKFVAPLIRRRLTRLEKCAVALIHDFSAEDQQLPILFATRYGEILKTHQLMEQFATEHALSPAGFTYSVHNAAPGVNAIITGNKQGYNAIAAGPDTLSAAYAIARAEILAHPGRELLLVYVETDCPELFKQCPDMPPVEIAFATVLTATPTATPAPEADAWATPLTLQKALA